jgi:hypothetical protein
MSTPARMILKHKGEVYEYRRVVPEGAPADILWLQSRRLLMGGKRAFWSAWCDINDAGLLWTQSVAPQFLEGWQTWDAVVVPWKGGA